MMEFNATFLIAMLSFVVFIMIMNAIFYNPICIIRKREDYINSNYEDAKRFENSAQEFNTTRAAKLEQVQEKEEKREKRKEGREEKRGRRKEGENARVGAGEGVWRE